MAEYSDTKKALKDSQGPQTQCREWKAKIGRAKKEAKKWHSESEEIMNIYRGEPDKHERKPIFNILASNTETLRPAVYNSTPLSDIRRRFRRDDPVGKAISEILESCLEYENDTLEFDESMQRAVLDTLLPGRGVIIVEYEPEIKEENDEDGNPLPLLGEDNMPMFGSEGQPLMVEELIKETTPTRHVQYNDFLHGEGQEWHEVDWIAIRYRMDRKECKEMFPETYKKIKNYTKLDEEYRTEDNDMDRKAETAEVWKIWDKEERKIRFINDTCDIELKVEDDPLGLENFFPCPAPLYFKKDQTSLAPIPPYRLYKEQAEELNRVITKRNAIISALKVRGMYDASLGEDIPKMLNSENMELVPIRNKQQIEAAGGIGNAIWMMPLNDLASALNQLYEAEARIKNTIYEITGLADIMRGATSAGAQTATEQRIKSQWGSLRIQDLQRDVQRLARDLFRIKAEIIAEHYEPETMMKISGVELEDPQLAQAVFTTMRDDKLRSYKIEIETDSTIQESVDRDMQGMSEVLQGIAQMFESLGPVVQAGAMPPEALQSLILGFIRKARLGRDVEDAFSQQGAIQQPPQPEAIEQAEQMKSDADTVLDAATRINEQNQQQISQIAQQRATYEKMVAESEDYAATAVALQQIVQDLQQTKGVDSQTIRALNAQQQALANSNAAMNQQIADLEQTMNTPKVVQFNRDDKGKILGAVAQPAPRPPLNGGE